MASKLEILITAQNTASKDILKLQKDINRLTTATQANTTGNAANTTSTKVMGNSMATAGAKASALRTTLVSLGGLVLFAAALRNIVQFEQAMANVRAVMLSVEDVTIDADAAFAALSAEARRLGATTIFSATQAANGLEFLGRAGFTANEAVSALEGTLNLAAAGGLGLGRAADIASNVLSGFALDASEAARVADVLALAAASSNTNVEQLGNALKFVAPIAASLGISIETTTAAIGKLSDAGLQGSLAGTGLRKVFLKLAAPSGSLNKVLDKLGISFEDVNSQTNDLSDIMALFAAQGLSAADAIQIFGDRGAPAALAMAQVSAEMKILNFELDNARGQAEVMADIMSDTLAGAFKALTSALTETVLQVGDDGLGGALRSTIDLFAGVVRVLNGTSDPLNENAILFRRAADAVETLFSVLKLLIGLKIAGFFLSSISAIATFGATMLAAVGGVSALSFSIRGLGLALAGALGPIGLLITLGAALISFATSDAPAAIAALEDTARATNRLTEAFKEASTGTIERSLIKARSAANKLVEELDDLDVALEDALEAGFQGFDSFEARRQNELLIESINDRFKIAEDELKKQDENIETLEALKDKAAVREADAAVKRLKALEKLEAEAAQNALSAVSQTNKTREALALAAIEQDKKLAKARAAIELEELKAGFNAQREFLESQQDVEFDEGRVDAAKETNAELLVLEQEFFAARRVLAEDQIQFDIALIARERKLQEDAIQEEREALEVAAELAIGASGVAREREALRTQLAARLTIIDQQAALELQKLDDKEELILTSTLAAQAKLTTEEQKALLDRNSQFADDELKAAEDREDAQKKEFDDRIDRIIAQGERERLAAQRDVDTGAESGFGLGARLEAIDQATVDKLQQVVADITEFNKQAQDPVTPEKLTQLGEIITEFADKAGVNLLRIKTQLATGLGDALFDIVEGTKSASEAFKDFAATFLREIARMILQQIALNLVKSAFGGFGGGGGVSPTGSDIAGTPFASGGFITGKGTSHSDSIPARLSTGEYVINADAVKNYGLNFMEAVNRMKLPGANNLPKFAITRPRRMHFQGGGTVDSGSGTDAAVATPSSLRIINVQSQGEAKEFINSSEGEQVIMNVMRRNSTQVKQYLR